MNKPRYFLMNNNNDVIGVVYESNKYGRTLAIQGKLEANDTLTIREVSGKKVADADLIDFLNSMIPIENKKIA
jgi:hypothetical protein